ncbi:MAG: hypothetical protein ACI8ZB_003639 [Desulforhopalus sp.]|jgi:hypothetical protein
MITIEKEVLYSKWNACDRDTRIRLACEYLKMSRSDEEVTNWLQFLEERLSGDE